jgi:type 1 glutamine amidotransferase
MSDFQADDELYVCLTGTTPVEVLATAHSKITGKDHPMAFVLNYGKGRVFHTTLGHDVRAIETPGTAELLRRGCLWAAGREP